MNKRKSPLSAGLYSAIISSPLGVIGLAFSQNKLIRLAYLPDYTELKSSTHPICQQVIKELNLYFKNPSLAFTSEFQLEGSPFQLRVWHTLKKIPRGKTVTYGEIAKKLQTSARAIGQACRTNPIPIIIPCHRIVAKEGLGGYSGKQQGKMLNIKKWLLAHESPMSS